MSGQPLRKPDIKEILELLTYTPLTPSDREERQRIVGPCRLRATELNGGPFSSWEEAHAATAKVVDPDTAMELRGLRCAEKVCYDHLEPILGKGTVDWRLMMCLEAGYSPRARWELDLMVQRAARAFDYKELERFASAMRLLKRAKYGYAAPDKARAVRYFLQRRAEGNPVKSGDEIGQFLERCDPTCFSGKRHNLSRILTGPILGHLKRKKAGRPPRQK